MDSGNGMMYLCIVGFVTLFVGALAALGGVSYLMYLGVMALIHG